MDKVTELPSTAYSKAVQLTAHTAVPTTAVLTSLWKWRVSDCWGHSPKAALLRHVWTPLTAETSKVLRILCLPWQWPWLLRSADGLPFGEDKAVQGHSASCITMRMIFLAEKDGKHVWSKSKFKWKINSSGGGEEKRREKKKGKKNGKLAKDVVSYCVLCSWRDFDNPWNVRGVERNKNHEIFSWLVAVSLVLVLIILFIWF